MKLYAYGIQLGTDFCYETKSSKIMKIWTNNLKKKILKKRRKVFCKYRKKESFKTMQTGIKE